MTMMIPGFFPRTHGIHFPRHPLAVQDGSRFLAFAPKARDGHAQIRPRVRSAGTFHPQSLASHRVSCQWTPQVFNTLFIDSITRTWHRITFERVASPRVTRRRMPALTVERVGHWAISRFKATPKTLISDSAPPRCRRYPLKLFGARQRSFPDRLFGLPLIKSAIPMHHFSVAQRDRFRKALAEKAKTRPTNVMVSVVYDRMILSLFNSFSQDTRGNMVCYPRSELLGKQRRSGQEEPASTSIRNRPVYLIYGTRLDTQESVRTILPIPFDVPQEDLPL